MPGKRFTILFIFKSSEVPDSMEHVLPVRMKHSWTWVFAAFCELSHLRIPTLSFLPVFPYPLKHPKEQDGTDPVVRP